MLGGVANFDAFIRRARTPSSSTPNPDQQVDDGGRQSRAATSDDLDEYTFSWQEKVFSQTEFNRYALADNCKTDLQSQYCRKIQELK